MRKCEELADKGEINSSQGIGSDDDTRDQFAQNGGLFEIARILTASSSTNVVMRCVTVPLAACAIAGSATQIRNKVMAENFFIIVMR